MVKVKRKTVSRRSKVIKKRHVKQQPSGLLTLIFLIGVLLLICLGYFFWGKGNSEEVTYQLPADVSLKKDAIKNVNLITPYQTITNTPTPAPLVGYCLHVPVLMYHHIQPEAAAKSLGQTSLTVDNGIFDQQMAYLVSHGYTPVWANELVNALLTHSGLPGKPIVITMDDGYADNDIYALPILKKYGFKANLMLASGLVGANSDMLTWGQVNDLKNNGVYLTNHTWSHWPITNGSQAKIESEIVTAQNQIQQYTGQTVNIFTYPYGSFNSNAIQTLQRKGYLGAFTEIPGQWQCDSFIMTLHRTRVGNTSLAYYGL